MTLECHPNIAERETPAPISERQTMAAEPRSVLVASAPKRSLQRRWERRWIAACGVWFAVVLALTFGGTDWRTAVMVSATAFMLARAGDMLDDH